MNDLSSTLEEMMRDDYDKMSYDLTKLGCQVKPFREILREELGDMVK